MTTRKAARPAKSAAKIAIGADHAGFAAKEHLKNFLLEKKHTVADCGAYAFDKKDDYPDIAFAVAKNIAQGKAQFGILLCGSGQGVCIAANKVRGIRATIAWNAASAQAARTDDDANILCLPARMLSNKALEKIASIWLETPFSGLLRHTRRIKKLER
ncbi:RpiB/LacA/LacB family sugar-phosphate isomerase [Candidatus Uhrbacteria bacterium]|nr:RpiB/LacA/LacB family sugar-phosphate isomerase [Candidatus Uhrbacteria bacterium]